MGEMLVFAVLMNKLEGLGNRFPGLTIAVWLLWCPVLTAPLWIAALLPRAPAIDCTHVDPDGNCKGEPMFMRGCTLAKNGYCVERAR